MSPEKLPSQRPLSPSSSSLSDRACTPDVHKRRQSSGQRPLSERARSSDTIDDATTRSDASMGSASTVTSASEQSSVSPTTVRKPAEQRERLPTPETPLPLPSRKRKLSPLCEAGADNVPSQSPTEHRRPGAAVEDVCLCTKIKIPRPRNAFILYRQHHQAAILAQNPGITNPEISKVLGEHWKSQPLEVKNRWRGLAEEEKQRHREQHPEYRYQPRRSGGRNSVGETQTSASFPRCSKCGGRNMLSPATPSSTNTLRSSISHAAPDTPGMIQSANQQAHSMNELSLQSPHRRNSTRQYPLNINVPSAPQNADSVMEDGEPHSAKRRRFTNSAYVGPGQHLHGATNMPISSSYHNGAGQSNADHRRLSNTTMSPMGPLTTNHVHGQVPPNLTLPPIQTATATKPPEITYPGLLSLFERINMLGRIAPPLRHPKPPKSTYKVRGTLVAIEGDQQNAVAQVAHWLKTFLEREKYAVRAESGPEPSKFGRDTTISNYLSLIQDWHCRGRDIAEYITTPAKPETGQVSGDLRANETLPVCLLHHYHLYATNVWSSQMPITDYYQLGDHWQWTATLWRGIVGPDVTVYVRDAGPEEWVKEKDVEVRTKQKCILVRRERVGSGGSPKPPDEKTLRRLGFELGEWIRSVNEMEMQAEAHKINEN